MSSRDEYRTFAEMAASQREGIDYVIDYRVELGRPAVLAIHGGAIERHTDTIARAIAGSDLSYYLLIGTRRSENKRYLHVASHRFSDPRAMEVVASAPAVVSVHGHRSTTESFVMVGGCDKSAAGRAISSFQQAGIAVRACARGLEGLEPGNICNRGPGHVGVQLELSVRLRQELMEDEARLNRFCEIVRTDVLLHSSALRLMSEAEVSLRLALSLLRTNAVRADVVVAIDGAQVQTQNIIHFDITTFLQREKCLGAEGGRWQGRYDVDGCDFGLVVHSSPGQGDVVAELANGRTLRVESKKGPLARRASSPEYKLLREAIGQLMTIDKVGDTDILAVAVPSSPKFLELASRWQQAPLIERVGIRFILVDQTGNVSGLESVVSRRTE